MAELEQGLEELKEVKQAFKDNISANNVSTSNVEFRNMPDLLKQMEKKLPTQTKDINPTTSSQIVTADSGYKLSQVNVGAVNPADYYKPEQSLDITPKTTAQTITPSGNSVYNRVNVSAVTSAIDSNLIPTNIRKGKTILGVVGNLEADKPDQQKTISPKTSEQVVVADNGYELAKVTVNAVTSSIDSNIKSENIKQGVNILGVAGTFEGASQPKLQEKNVEPSIVYQPVVPDDGYDGLSKVNVSAVTSAIDKNIQPQNIKNGITILGVVGSMQTTSGSPKFGELVNGSIQTVESGDLSEINEIRSKAFIDCKNLTSAVIPSNITTIGASAFEGCSSLQTLHIADGVTTIGASAFKGISASVITIPSTLSVLETEVFADNLALTSITIPENITEIKDNAFSGCTNLTEITMDGLTPPVVTNISLPSSVTAIYVKYGAYESYLAQWSDYSSKIVRLPAIPSSITVIVNNYLNELVQGASVTVSGNNLTFTGTTNENGVFVVNDLQPATYTVSVADIDGFVTPETKEIVITENSHESIIFTYEERPAIPPFALATPAEISAISAEISANNMTSAEVEAAYGWKIGDTIDITLNTSEVIQMRIIGFNHDNKSDGSGKAGITLDMVDILDTSYRMNSTATNKSGWGSTEMRNTTIPTLFASLPTEWQTIIKYVSKTSSSGGNSYNVHTTSDQIFFLSVIEVFGSDTTEIEMAQNGTKEGTQYEYWAIHNTQSDRVKKQNEKGWFWWLRSCFAGYTKQFNRLGNAGVLGTQDANNEVIGVSFAFCV